MITLIGYEIKLLRDLLNALQRIYRHELTSDELKRYILMEVGRLIKNEAQIMNWIRTGNPIGNKEPAGENCRGEE